MWLLLVTLLFWYCLMRPKSSADFGHWVRNSRGRPWIFPLLILLCTFQLSVVQAEVETGLGSEEETTDENNYQNELMDFFAESDHEPGQGSSTPNSLSNGFHLLSLATECTPGDTRNCDVNAGCTKMSGDVYVCTCNAGYVDNSVTTTTNKCDDINECLIGSHNCKPGSTCTNVKGSFTCACNAGYTIQNGISCVDLNECSSRGGHNCHPNATCTNNVGSYTCSCNAGYSGNGVNSCSNVDECALSAARCHSSAACKDTPGSYTCTCNSGYVGNGVDICNSWDVAPKIVISGVDSTLSLLSSSSNNLFCTVLQFAATAASASASAPPTSASNQSTNSETSSTLPSSPSPSTTTDSIVSVPIPPNSPNFNVTLPSTGILYSVTASCNGFSSSLPVPIYASAASDPVTMAIAEAAVLPLNVTLLIKHCIFDILALGSMEQIVNFSLTQNRLSFQLAQQNPATPTPTALVLALKAAAANGRLYSSMPFIARLTVDGYPVVIAVNEPVQDNRNRAMIIIVVCVATVVLLVSVGSAVACMYLQRYKKKNCAVSPTNRLINSDPHRKFILQNWIKIMAS